MSIIRDLTLKIEQQISLDDIFLIIGPRQAGKTTLLHQVEAVVKNKGCASYFLNLEDPDYLSLLKESPKNLFKIFPFDLTKKSFIFIDEIQYLDNPTNFLKFFYDEYKGRVKIIASGSSAFYLDKKFKDSLAGRKRIFYLFTLSFREFLKFKNENELAQKDFLNLALSEKEKVKLYFREYIIYGGYPRVVLSPFQEKEEVLRDIAFSYIKKDIFEANIRQEDIFYKLFRLLASQVGNLVNCSELASTLRVSRTAIEDYIYLMQQSFHVRFALPFYKNLRKEITKMPKVYFLDLGLRNFFAKNFRGLEEREDIGQILENALFRQLIEKFTFEDIKFWRTIQAHEVDFVAGEECAYEVRANPEKFEAKKYQLFKENYPNIKLSVACLEYEKTEISGHSIVEIWQV